MLTDSQRESFEETLAGATTMLDNMFFGWLLGHIPFDIYAEELMISELDGPGNEPNDFVGEP